MLRFNNEFTATLHPAYLFQYITCYGLIALKNVWIKVIDVFQYITCYGLIKEI